MYVRLLYVIYVLFVFQEEKGRPIVLKMGMKYSDDDGRFSAKNETGLVNWEKFKEAGKGFWWMPGERNCQKNLLPSPGSIVCLLCRQRQYYDHRSTIIKHLKIVHKVSDENIIEFVLYVANGGIS